MRYKYGIGLCLRQNGWDMTEVKWQDVEKEKICTPKSDLCSKLKKHCFFTLQSSSIFTLTSAYLSIML